MRFCLIIILLLSLDITLFAQNRQKRSKGYKKIHTRVGRLIPVNYIFGVEANIAYIDKNSTSLVGVNFAHLFKDNIFGGIYGETKLGVTKANTTLDQNRYLYGNLRYSSMGIFIGKYIEGPKFSFANYHSRISFSLRSGLGRDYIESPETGEPLNHKDYLHVFIPVVGIEIPVSKFLSFCFAVNYHIVTRIDIYYSKNQLSGLGTCLSLRYSIFKSIVSK